MRTIPTSYVTDRVLRYSTPARRSGKDAHAHVLVLNIYVCNIYIPTLFALTKENNYNNFDLPLFDSDIVTLYMVPNYKGLVQTNCGKHNVIVTLCFNPSPLYNVTVSQYTNYTLTIFIDNDNKRCMQRVEISIIQLAWQSGRKM